VGSERLSFSFNGCLIGSSLIVHLGITMVNGSYWFINVYNGIMMDNLIGCLMWKINHV
jgi:hypothetical protein